MGSEDPKDRGTLGKHYGSIHRGSPKRCGNERKRADVSHKFCCGGEFDKSQHDFYGAILVFIVGIIIAFVIAVEMNQ